MRERAAHPYSWLGLPLLDGSGLSQNFQGRSPFLFMCGRFGD